MDSIKDLKTQHGQSHSEIISEIRSIKDNNNKNFIDRNDYITTWVDIEDYFNHIYEIGEVMPFEYSIVLSHLLAMILLLLLLLSFLTIKYSNYLINHLNLAIRFPKLAKFLEYRLIRNII